MMRNNNAASALLGPPDVPRHLGQREHPLRRAPIQVIARNLLVDGERSLVFAGFLCEEKFLDVHKAPQRMTCVSGFANVAAPKNENARSALECGCEATAFESAKTRR